MNQNVALIEAQGENLETNLESFFQSIYWQLRQQAHEFFLSHKFPFSLGTNAYSPLLARKKVRPRDNFFFSLDRRKVLLVSPSLPPITEGGQRAAAKKGRSPSQMQL